MDCTRCDPGRYHSRSASLKDFSRTNRGFPISAPSCGHRQGGTAQFAGRLYPSAGSFITYVTRATGTKVAVAAGVITLLGYIVAVGGIYIFVGSYLAERIRQSP